MQNKKKKQVAQAWGKGMARLNYESVFYGCDTN